MKKFNFKKLVNLCLALVLGVSSLAGAIFTGIKTIQASADELRYEVLLYTIDFTDIDHKYLDEDRNWNSPNNQDKYYNMSELTKKMELEAQGWAVDGPFEIRGHDSANFIQSVPGSIFEAGNNEPYNFFVNTQSGFHISKTRTNETKIKITTAPVNYYGIGHVRSDLIFDEFNEVQTRDWDCHIMFNNEDYSDNITGFFEIDVSNVETMSIGSVPSSYNGNCYNIYKMEVYGFLENPIQPDVPEIQEYNDKLLYTYDFTNVDDKYLNPVTSGGITYPAVSATAVYSGYDELESIWRERITTDGWTLGDEFNIFDHSSNNFFQTVPGDLFRNENRDPYAFGLKMTSNTKFSKIKKNETRIKIYVDPVSYYYWGQLSYDCCMSNTVLETRTYNASLTCGTAVIDDNCTGVIEYDLTDAEIISISAGKSNSSGIDKARNIYKIEVYGTEAKTEEGPKISWLDDFFNNAGMTGFSTVGQLIIAGCAILIFIKIIKR